MGRKEHQNTSPVSKGVWDVFQAFSIHRVTISSVFFGTQCTHFAVTLPHCPLSPKTKSSRGLSDGLSSGAWGKLSRQILCHGSVDPLLPSCPHLNSVNSSHRGTGLINWNASVLSSLSPWVPASLPPYAVGQHCSAMEVFRDLVCACEQACECLCVRICLIQPLGSNQLLLSKHKVLESGGTQRLSPC